MKKSLDKLKKRFRAMQPRLLIVQLIISLAYPIAKAAISEYNRLLIFTDSLTIIAALLLIVGVVYRLYQRGDFDISGFVLKRGVQRNQTKKQSFDTYMDDKKQEREESFNYPLFLGLVYIAVALVRAYAVL